MARSDGSDAALQAVAEDALGAWGLNGAELELVSRSENTVYRVEAQGGPYVLRIHRPGYHNLAELESEQMWTSALNDAGIRAPVPVPTRSGERYAVVPLPGTDETRNVGLAEWADGVVLQGIIEQEDDPANIAAHYRSLGAIAALIHDQAARWRPPQGFTRHAFDADGLMGPAPFWGPFWALPQLTGAERRLFIRARDAIHARLSAYGKSPDSYGLIHADLHPHNVLMDDGVLRVIDFDDAGFGWHAYELAVALFHSQRHEHFGVMRSALIEGYRSEYELPDAAVDLLDTFLLVRGLAILGWILERPEVDRTAGLRRLIDSACAQARAQGY